jgi:repressor LexA
MRQAPRSDLQDRIYAFILTSITTQGMPPTIREIGRAMGIPSTGHIDHHLTMLEKKGRIVRLPGKSRGMKLTQPAGIPIRGTIAAGTPLDIFADTPAFLQVDQSFQAANVFALVVRGQSMIDDSICDGDYVVVTPQHTCENGDIVVATHVQAGISGSATLKRFFQEHDHVRLQPANSAMKPLLVPKKEWDREWVVQGKVIALFRPYQLAHIP